MYNDILAQIGGFMGQLRVPTQMGQGIISAVEFFLVGGRFMIDLFIRAFGFLF